MKPMNERVIEKLREVRTRVDAELCRRHTPPGVDEEELYERLSDEIDACKLLRALLRRTNG